MNVVYPDLTISPQLQAVIMRALEKDPAAPLPVDARVRASDHRHSRRRCARLSAQRSRRRLSIRCRSCRTCAGQSDCAAVYSGPAAPDPDARAQSRAAAPIPSANRARSWRVPRPNPAPEAITVPPTARSRGGLAAVAIAVAVLGGGGALFRRKTRELHNSNARSQRPARHPRPSSPVAASSVSVAAGDQRGAGKVRRSGSNRRANQRYSARRFERSDWRHVVEERLSSVRPDAV